MIMVYVPFGGARQRRQVREEGTMKRIVMWLMVVALMAAMMGATAVPAFTDVGKRQTFCGQVAIPGYVTTNPEPYGPAVADNAQDGTILGGEVRENASACNKGEGPPFP
jgi:hypothetical protein